MSVFSVISLLGGLALFLYGMNVMSSGLEKMAGGKLEQTLRKMTSNRILSMVLGAGITVAIQSSSALTVMLVGLVNSGIMQFGQTIGPIMGSNIGTTFTAWILSLSGIKTSETSPLNLLKPEYFSMILALIGVFFTMLSKNQRRRDLGGVLVGFAVLMFGMKVMSDSMAPLASPEYAAFFTALKNPIVALFVATLFTGVIQSSAAAIGILMALAATGQITFGMAIPIIVGENIGTCATALLSSIGVSKDAKKVAVAHLIIKCIGTVICLVPFYIINGFCKFGFMSSAISIVWIAIIHSAFNIINTAILLPFSKQIVALVNKIIPTEEKAEVGPKLDERLITMPSLAASSAFDATVEMANLSKDAFINSLSLIRNYDKKTLENVLNTEETVDVYEDKLGTYLVKLSREQITDMDSRLVSKILHTINDFERISDHACNMVKVATEIHEKKIVFSGGAVEEIKTLTAAIDEILNLTVEAFDKNDIAMASKVEPLEQVIDKLIADIKNRHVDRLQSGDCTIEMGFVLNDLLTNYERVSDHCSNVAVAIIETAHGSFKTHEYLQLVKEEQNDDFATEYKAYLKKYDI